MIEAAAVEDPDALLVLFGSVPEMVLVDPVCVVVVEGEPLVLVVALGDFSVAEASPTNAANPVSMILASPLRTEVA